ncbi:hypothetical protein CJU89_1627 [Yarrowia sp. B02]|nr:hypothetical protein CJU89_1627 [Yarrowia sp. B02]
MKLISLLSLAAVALAATGDQYHLKWRKSGNPSVSWNAGYDGQSIRAPQEDDAQPLVVLEDDYKPLVITEHDGPRFSVDGKMIGYQELLTSLWTGPKDEDRKLTGSVFDIAGDGVITLHDGPKEFYICQPSVGVLNVKNHISRCRFKQDVQLFVEKI